MKNYSRNCVEFSTTTSWWLSSLARDMSVKRRNSVEEERERLCGTAGFLITSSVIYIWNLCPIKRVTWKLNTTPKMRSKFQNKKSYQLEIVNNIFKPLKLKCELEYERLVPVISHISVFILSFVLLGLEGKSQQLISSTIIQWFKIHIFYRIFSYELETALFQPPMLLKALNCIRSLEQSIYWMYSLY